MICRRGIMSLYSYINYNRVCKALHVTIPGTAAEQAQEKSIIVLIFNIVEVVIIVLSLLLYK